MWMFWMAVSGLAAAAAALVIARAAAVARALDAGAEDPALPMYRRQLGELEGLAQRGLLGPDEHQAARAEAARRLLSAADRRAAPETGGGRATRVTVAIASAGAAATALCLYLLIGSPGMPDQPYRARVQAWRNADPATLDAPRMAAVLQDVARGRPRDAQVYDFLGRAELAAGDGFAAARAFEHAGALDPSRADLKTELGEALIADGDGQVTPAARAAFQQALRLDPKNATARYFLARADIASGRTDTGLAVWRALAAELPPADPRRQALLADIQRVAAGDRSLSDAASASPLPDAGPQAGQLAFIRGMVAKQAADLAARPDDPDGWARLIRSYGVLGDKAAQQQALSGARRLFRSRPDALARIEAEANPARAPG